MYKIVLPEHKWGIIGLAANRREKQGRWRRVPESQCRAGCGCVGGSIMLDVLMGLPRDSDLEIC